MRSICLYFQIHQPIVYKTYRFFDIGSDHIYENTFATRDAIAESAQNTYLPGNRMLLDLIQKHQGAFKVSFSISGLALELFEKYAPEVIESFQALNATGCVEFLGETYSHSLCSLHSEELFVDQVKRQNEIITRLFQEAPKVFRNSAHIYSDEIGEMVYNMGYKAMVAEGAKHLMGWKSSNQLFKSMAQPNLKVLLRNYKLSNDITLKFSNKEWSEYPLRATKYSNWISSLPETDTLINIFMDYQTIGGYNSAEDGIFTFFEQLPTEVLADGKFGFSLPSEVLTQDRSEEFVHVPDTISWTGEERDLSAWLGSQLQKEAFEKLYGLKSKIQAAGDPQVTKQWYEMQSSDHLYFMGNRSFGAETVSMISSPFKSPYDAFINFMNMVNDMSLRLDEIAATLPEEEQIKRLSKDVSQSKELINELTEENRELKEELQFVSANA